jgi:hypothetical protein
MQFSDSKKEKLIGYAKQYYGAKEVKVTFIPSADGALIVDYYIDIIPTKMGLNNNIANLIIVSKALAGESAHTLLFFLLVRSYNNSLFCILNTIKQINTFG